MLRIALLGWPTDGRIQTIKPGDATEIAKFVIAEMLRLRCRFDLRLLVTKAFPDFQQWKDGETETHWQDLVTASIEEHVIELRPARTISRDGTKQDEQQTVREILNEYGTRDRQVEAWIERTGKSERAFYRRRAEIDTR